MARRDYAGGAVPATLVTGIDSDDLTVTISDDTGWPDGANGKFGVTLDRTGATPEKILVLSRSGTVLTLASTDDRGVDGTTAQAHSSGVTVEHTILARDVDEPNGHINDTTRDDHSQYLNNARHDIPARHVAGTAIPTAAAGNIYPDDPAGEGIASTLARSDHKHAVAAAAAGTILPDDTASEGSAPSFARSDHRHAIAADVAGTSAAGDTAGEGVATSFARSDHVHGRTAETYATVTEIADIATAESAGTSTTIARGDHVHKGLGVDAWTDYSGTIVLTNITMGSGGVTVARYTQTGKTCHVSIALVFGTGGLLSGNAAVSVPAASVNRASQSWSGSLVHTNTGVAHYIGAVLLPAASSTAILLSGVSATNQGLTNATSPFTTDDTDRIYINLCYETA